jgi:hypothetical protein
MRGPDLLIIPAIITNFFNKSKLPNFSDNSAKDLPPYITKLLPNVTKEFVH